MADKRSKYDTDPLDPDFVRRTEEMSGGATRDIGRTPNEEARRSPTSDDPTRRLDEQISSSYPSVFVPPAYQPPPEGFSSFGAEHGKPPAVNVPPQPGPHSAFQQHGYAPPTSRKVEKLGLPENLANVLPYAPFYIGMVASIVELLIVPRNETRVRFHAAQGLALQLAITAGSIAFSFIGSITNSGFGGFLFWLASFIFLIVSMVRVSKGKPHHIAPLDDATRWLNHHIELKK